MLHVGLRRKSSSLPLFFPSYTFPPRALTSFFLSPRQNCVYTLYADDLLAYNESLSTALSALRSSGTPPSTWPEEIRAFAEKGKVKGGDAAAFGGRRTNRSGVGADGDGNGEGGKVTREEIMRDVLVDVDPALRAFLE